MLQFLNVFFFTFHTAWLLFNCCGWVWRKTRPWHLATVLLTALSWFLLGFWYGWGYCLCTDWHWQVRARLGYSTDSHSYTQLLLREQTGIDTSPTVADTVTVGVFVVVAVLSVVLNLRDWRTPRPAAAKPTAR
jgi:hypothetical protein